MTAAPLTDADLENWNKWVKAQHARFLPSEAERLLATIQADRERIAVLEAALRPFANAAACLDETDNDRWGAWEHPVSVDVNLGNFKAAARALLSGEPK